MTEMGTLGLTRRGLETGLLRATAPDLDPTDRGGDGNVGIIRSPLRATTLPDNRHEVEDERASRGRPSEPPRPRVLHEPYREVGREA